MLVNILGEKIERKMRLKHIKLKDQKIQDLKKEKQIRRIKLMSNVTAVFFRIYINI